MPVTQSCETCKFWDAPISVSAEGACIYIKGKWPVALINLLAGSGFDTAAILISGSAGTDCAVWEQRKGNA